MPDFLAEELQDFINRQYMLDPKRRLFPYTKSFLSHEMLRGCKDSGVKKYESMICVTVMPVF